MFKNGCKFLLVITILMSCIQNVYSADVSECRNVVLTINATTKPNTYASFMVLKQGGDLDLPKEEDLYDTEVVETDHDGNCTYSVMLKNAQINSGGKIENYMLKSSIKGIDINSGTVTNQLTVKIDGNETEFSATPVIGKNGIVFVPIAETFEKLGVPLSYHAETGVYSGKGNNGEIEIVMGKNTAEIDWVDVEMPAASQKINGADMIPLSIIADAVKTEAIYDGVHGEISIKKPQPQEEKEEFDIEKVIQTLPAGEELVSDSAFVNGMKIATGAQYATLTKTAENTAIIETHRNNYGEIPKEWQGIEIASWSSKKDFNKGQTGLLSFDARAISTEDESGNAIINVIYQRSSDWNKALYESVAIPGDQEWKKIYLPVYSAFYDMNKSNGAHFMLQVGGKPMSIEIKNFSFVNYGTDVSVEMLKPSISEGYKGIEEDALWRKEAYRRIEKYRKNDMEISVVDENGKGIENAEITADMTDNEFMFGVSLCKNELLNLDLTTKAGATYNELLNNSFNAGVCGLEMKVWDMTDDDGFDGIKMVNEFLSRGKRVRGHAILWESGNDCLPRENPDQASYDEWYKTGVEYARNIAYTFKGKLAQWDVQNEPSASNYLSSKYNSRRIQADIFKEVRKIDPDVKLYVNETGIEGMNSKSSSKGYMPSLLEIVRELKRYGAPVDGIGIQAHCVNYNYPQGFYHQLDECSELVDEVAVTEYDLLNEKTEFADEYLRDMLLATFSHPKATSFTVWGVQDTMHWRNAAPFYDSDWNERPAMKVWNDMVNNEFATHSTVKTDENGKAVIRGFRGTYNIQCKIGDDEYTVPFKLVKEGENKVIFTLAKNGISAQVSNNPDANPEPIEFNDVISAIKDYESKNSAYYDVEFFNKNFKGESGIENSSVLNGGDLNSAGYINGNCWASKAGLNGMITASSDGGVYIKTGEERSADLRHRLNLQNKPENTDVMFEFVFDTLNCNTNGRLDTEFCLNSENAEYALGNLIYDNGNYIFEAKDGESVALEKERQYMLAASLKHSNGNDALCYELSDENGNIVWSYAHTQDTNMGVVDELLIHFNSAGGNGDAIFKFWSAGIRCKKDGEILSFGNVKSSTEILNESLRDFDISSAKYMGTHVPGSDTSLTPEEGWGLYSPSGGTNAFRYDVNGHYLYAIRNTPNGENILQKSFEPIQDGEELTLKYNMYISCPAQWYDSSGSAKIILGSADKSVNLPITSFEYDGYHAFWLNLLGEKNDVDWAGKNDYNLVPLTVECRLSPDGDGNYNAHLCISNNYGFKHEVTVADVLTAAEVQKLSAIFITSKTDFKGTRYNKNLCGFKNIIAERTAKPYETLENGIRCAADAYSFEIPYNNVTGQMKEVTLICALYRDHKLAETKILSQTLKNGKGCLTFKEKNLNNYDYARVFLWKDANGMIALKNSEMIIIE